MHYLTFREPPNTALLTAFVPHIHECAGAEKRPKAANNAFFERGEGEPNTSEVLFFALLLLVDAERARELGELQKWASAALREAADAEQLQEQWAPSDEAAIYGRMGTVYDGAWESPALERIAAGMQSWRGAGRWAELSIPQRMAKITTFSYCIFDKN